MCCTIFPVPRDRPLAADQSGANSKGGDEWLDWAHDIYEKIPVLKDLRNSSLFKDMGSRLIAEYKKVRGQHPYPDILSEDTPGWQLMSAILRQFIQEVQPLPS